MTGPWVEIHLKVLDRNIRHVQAALGGRTALIMVVKANAYGHGVGPVVRCAVSAGVEGFAVAYLAEAVEVRRNAPDAKILLLGGSSGEDVPALVRDRILPVLLNVDHARELAGAATGLSKPLPVHVKIDTGMGRLGIPWFDAGKAVDPLRRLTSLDIQGACTHFAAIDPDQPEISNPQADRFQEAVQAFQSGLNRKLFRHVSGSRAMLFRKDLDFEGVRPGIVLYGYGARGKSLRFKTDPVLQWKTRVVQVKPVPENFPVGYYSTFVTTTPTDIATLAVGYADGYPRHLSNKGSVLLRGRRCPVVGRVSMNWITVDVGPESGVRPGEEVVLLGAQGGESIWADELTGLYHTIAYEILTSIRPGSERVYIH